MGLATFSMLVYLLFAIRYFPRIQTARKEFFIGVKRERVVR